LEDPAVIERVQNDPYEFLEGLKPPVILDEIQNTPQLFNYVRTVIDGAPRRMGRWFITGSQEAGLMQGVTESMAGRAAIFQLLPLSTRETSKVNQLRGGFPEALARPRLAATWFRSYLQTYLERDVRAVSSIRDLATFRKYLALLASRCGQILNKTDLAAPLGVSVPTITDWLSILEITGQILLVPPYFENFGKRLIKAPKLYFTDSGLACHLLGIESESQLRNSPFRGPIFEGFVASEIVKLQLNSGRAKQLYFFRDQQGLEVDFVVPHGPARIALVECKAGRTVRPADGGPIARLMDAIKSYQKQGFVVHQPPERAFEFTALRPGMQAVGVNQLLDALATK
jgi:predicted AAA+ superfamily ATPase